MPDAVRRLHREAPLTDLHAHPSLKAFLFRRNLWHHYWSGRAFDPFSSRSDFQALADGEVGVLWASHYLPERDLFSDCFLIRAAAIAVTPVYVKLTTKSYWTRLGEMMDAFERELDREPTRIELARSMPALDRIRGQGKIAAVHTVEGAHVLEGDPNRVGELARRGVAMLTLNHFYRNGVGAQVDALPSVMSLKKLCPFKFGHGVPPMLTQYGREVIQALSASRMLVDITHCWPDARRQIYSELNRARPVVASHVGVQALRPDPYNLADEEIREIAASGGLIGIILMPYWLASDQASLQPGADQVVDTIEHVVSTAGSWDHVAIGSDFDGFTDPPDDVPDASRLGVITETLLGRGASETDIKKVLGGNADRVLRAAWS